jgi:superfamily I DNA/RNA helicase
MAKALTLPALDQAIDGLARQGDTPGGIAGSLTLVYRTKRADLIRLILAHQRGEFHADTVPIAPPARIRTPPPEPAMAIPAPSGFQLTAQHEAIYAAVRRGESIVIQARAGSGKTTTVIKLVEMLLADKPDLRVLCVAFTEAIKLTLEQRMPKGVTSKTLHGLCLGAIRRARGWFGANGDNRISHSRVSDAARQFVLGISPPPADIPKAVTQLGELWSLARATMTPVDDLTQLMAMVTSYGLEFVPDERLLTQVAALDAHLSRSRQSISFDEMLTAVYDAKLSLGSYDLLVIDEAQDLNRLQMAVLARMGVKQVIAVGDDQQAIYGWRGADHRAIASLMEVMGITTALPLSVTYRCSRAVVDEARKYVPNISAAPHAPHGQSIMRKPDERAITIRTLRAGDLVMARTNAPLLGALLERRRCSPRVPMAIMGKKQGDGLRHAIEDAARAANSTDSTVVAAHVRAELEQVLALLKEQGKAMPIAVQTIQSDYEMVLTLLGEHATTVDAHRAVGQLFTTEPLRDGITFSTIHKAKGLEAERAVILGYDRIPHPRVLATGNAALIAQERNLLYVAVTRAKKTLVKQFEDG